MLIAYTEYPTLAEFAEANQSRYCRFRSTVRNPSLGAVIDVRSLAIGHRFRRTKRRPSTQYSPWVCRVHSVRFSPVWFGSVSRRESLGLARQTLLPNQKTTDRISRDDPMANSYLCPKEVAEESSFHIARLAILLGDREDGTVVLE